MKKTEPKVKKEKKPSPAESGATEGEETKKPKRTARKASVKKLAEKPTEAEVIIRPEAEFAEEGMKKDRYFEGVGRRKTAIARVRLFTRGEKEFLVNSKPYKNYFPILEFQQILLAALEKMKCEDKFRVQAVVKGGGIRGQAEAVRLAIARALVKFNIDFKKRLRKAGFLTRDPRMRERKKFGLKRARRAPQWQKR